MNKTKRIHTGTSDTSDWTRADVDDQVVKVLSPMGNCVAYSEGASVVVRTHEGVYLKTLKNGFGTPITTLDFSPDGSMLMAGSITGEVLVWDIPTYRILLANRAPLPLSPILDIVGSPKNTYVAVLDGRCELRIWSLRHRTCILQQSVSGGATFLTWSLNEAVVVTNDGDWCEVPRDSADAADEDVDACDRLPHVGHLGD